jgi:two-component system chemotaxis response regulator CheB
MTPTRDIIVIGGSAGARQALADLVTALPEGFAASVLVVLHAHSPLLPWLGATSAWIGTVAVHLAVDGEPVLPGQVYLAPGGYNMLLERGRLRVLASPKEHHTYPSINALFRTAAITYGPRVVGIVLSGALSDGTAGLWEIKRRGGLAIVQVPVGAAAVGQ